MFSVLNLPNVLLFYIYMVIASNLFKEKTRIKKDTLKISIKYIIIPIIVAFLFSLLFKNRINGYVPRLPLEIQPHIIPAYYLTIIMILFYYLVRAILRFDYYESHYLHNKTDYRFYYLLLLIFIIPYSVIIFNISYY